VRRTMTDKGVAALRPRGKRYAVSDPELRGHWIRIQPTGSKGFWTVTRNPQGKQVWTFIRSRRHGHRGIAREGSSDPSARARRAAGVRAEG
jgi:hypothetical protein